MNWNSRWIKGYIVLAVLGLAALVLLARSGVGPAPEDPASNYRAVTTAEPGELHAERTKVYHDAAAAAEDHNGRPLSKIEKEELWQMSRTDAEANLEEKNAYDPSKAEDH